MNIPLLAIAIVVIIVSVVSARGTSTNQNNVNNENEVLSESTQEPKDTPWPETPSPTPTPTATSTPTASPVDNSSWVYPSATVVSQGGTLILTSGDSTDTITDWYRARIASNGYNIRNSIKTSANDVVKNVIQAVGKDNSINVEITKGSGDTLAKIEVELGSL